MIITPELKEVMHAYNPRAGGGGSCMPVTPELEDRHRGARELAGQSI